MLRGDGVGGERLERAGAEVGVRREHGGAVGDLVAAYEDLLDRGVLARDQSGEPEEGLDHPGDLLGLEHPEDAGEGLLGAELALDQHVVGRGYRQRTGDGVGEAPACVSISSSEAGSGRAAANVRSWSLTRRRSEAGRSTSVSSPEVRTATSPTWRRESPSSA